MNHRLRCGRSVTDDDLDELRACFELGFNFDSPDLDPKLSSTFPTLEIYHAVNWQYCAACPGLRRRSFQIQMRRHFPLGV
ncbi:hypothetical protein PHJA_002912200 [Phtheirospermum japonicum]|uniref:Uncharacterized protein n=1 Tax=Phtheirospermum japonicum TaxID=374723 RepID=A0A830D6E3_9LAMI|nr:hypothetical protein PHJA_002912200 [Phtheirospermum japonicum]